MKNVDLVETFLNTFQLLTPKQQRVWRYLQSYAKTYRNVFPSHKKIAEACSCHRDTVIQSIKRFKEFGWLRVIKRAYTSCVYFLVDVLVGINTSCNKTFIKKNLPKKSDTTPTPNPTVINNNKYKLKNDNEIENVQIFNLNHLKLSPKDICILSSLAKKNPVAMNKAILDLKNFEKTETIKNSAALITARFKFHSLEDKVPEEIKHLNLTSKDIEILTKYNAKDRKSFLFAYEDFKTYNIFREVDNIAAFITSRFKSYLKGEVSPKENPLENNKHLAQQVEKSAILTMGRIIACNKYLEFSHEAYSIVIEYKDPGFKQKLKNLVKKRKIHGIKF